MCVHGSTPRRAQDSDLHYTASRLIYVTECARLPGEGSVRRTCWESNRSGDSAARAARDQRSRRHRIRRRTFSQRIPRPRARRYHSVALDRAGRSGRPVGARRGFARTSIDARRRTGGVGCVAATKNAYSPSIPQRLAAANNHSLRRLILPPRAVLAEGVLVVPRLPRESLSYDIQGYQKRNVTGVTGGGAGRMVLRRAIPLQAVRTRMPYAGCRILVSGEEAHLGHAALRGERSQARQRGPRV